jgi:hypothetical protein
MSRRSHHFLYTAMAALTLALLMPSESRAGRFCECLFGHSPAAVTTYAPPYVPPAPVVAAPACGSCAPCSSCAPAIAPACGACVPQTCQYAPEMPGVVYRALYAPAPVVAYQPAAYSVGYAPAAYTSYVPVTTYRPFFGTYQTRLVPYTTYRPLETPVVSYAYSPCTSCAAPCASCSSCNACTAYSPCESSSACSSGCGCGAVSYEAPATGCAACAASTPGQPAYAPATPPEAPAAPANPQSPYNPGGRTFEEKKPVDPQLKPIPQPENAHPSSLPAPSLPDPNAKTAANVAPARVQLVAQPAEEVPLKDDGGWHAVKE